MANNNRPDRGRNRKAGNVIESPADKAHQLAKELRIAEKTKKFYDELIDNPKLNQVEAYKNTHDVSKHTHKNSADVLASKLIKSDKYAIYKASAVGKAKRRVVELVSSGNENIALKASQDVLDRTEGKATQKIESTRNVVEVKLDLTGVRLGTHYIRQDQRDAIAS